MIEMSYFDIANALANNCSHKSSAFNTEVLNKDERQNINFSSEELQDALYRAHDASTGPDEIHHQLLKHLPN